MPAKKVSASRAIIFGVLVISGLYVVCVIGLTIGQRKLLYYPCKQSIIEAQPNAARIGFRAWENAAGEVIGWFRPSQTGPATRTILLLHGNAGCASVWFHYAEGFQSAEPINFYILEYPGYGLWFEPEATHGDLHDGAPAIAKELTAFWKNHEAPNAPGK